MTDKVESHIDATTHAVKHSAKTLEVVFRNFRFTQTEMDGRNQVIELNRFYILLDNFTHLCSIPLIFVKYSRFMDPWRHGLVGRQMHLLRFSMNIRFLYPCFYR